MLTQEWIMQLSSAQRRFLRGLTHHINPVVMIGEKGLTGHVLEEIEIALDHHELIKVKLRSDRQTRNALSLKIAEQSRATIVHQIGQVTCYFRRNARKPVIELPGERLG
jgi:RNA-binding protein